MGLSQYAASGTDFGSGGDTAFDGSLFYVLPDRLQ